MLDPDAVRHRSFLNATGRKQAPRYVPGRAAEQVRGPAPTETTPSGRSSRATSVDAERWPSSVWSGPIARAGPRLVC